MEIIIDGVIGWDYSASDFRDKLKEANGKNLEIQISSPGGSVYEGNTIYDLIIKYKKDFPNSQVIITSFGISASMASIIALAGNKHIVFSNTTYFIHNTRTTDIGDKNTFRKTADVLERLDNIVARVYNKKSGKSIKEIKLLMDEETYFYGQEIIDAGFADEIIQIEDKSEKDEKIALANNAIKETILKMQNTKDYDFYDDCFKAVAMIEPENPFPNEHAARLKDPKSFDPDSYRRTHGGTIYGKIKVPSTIDIIWAKLKSNNQLAPQALRFPTKNWSVEEAKKWLKDHNIKYILFEPAKEKSSNIDDEKCETCMIIDMENFHTCIFENSDNYDPKSFRVKIRKNEEWPKDSGKLRTIHLLIAKPKGKSAPSDPTKLIEFRYPIEEWTLSEAKAHCKHNKGRSFEKADKDTSDCFEIISTDVDENKNMEVKNNMTPEELKQKFPDLYNTIFKAGINQEYERVKSHIVMGRAAGNIEMAVKNIEGKNKFTPSISAEYMAEGMKTGEIKKRKADNVDTGSTSGDDDEEDTKQHKNRLMKARGIR